MLFALAIPVWAQESALGADFRGEGERFDASCINFSAAGCAQLLFTDHPLHIAVGSLAPQNGFGSGIAFLSHYTPNENWRLFFSADAVATWNRSWRAGGYMTAVLIRHPKIVVGTGSAGHKQSKLALPEMPVFHVYAQAESLNQLGYYGLGQGTPRSESIFGMTETIVGGNVVWPVLTSLNISLLGEANGRFFSLRGATNDSIPSIETVNTEGQVPGLLSQPSYAEFGQGVRLRPSFAHGFVRLNYTAKFQEWVANDTGFSFRRFSADLSHQFPLYRNSRALLPHDFDGPNNCAIDPTIQHCPSPTSRNLEGSFGFQFLYTASYTSAASIVPFYLDPTIGGSDID